MKAFKIFFIVSFVLLLVLFISLSVYIRVYGKDFVQNALTDALGQNVQIGKLTYQLPLGLKVHDVYVKNLIQVKNIQFKFDYTALRKGQFDISFVKVVNPVIMIARAPDDNDEAAVMKIEAPLSRLVKNVSQFERKLKVKIYEVSFKDGRIHYTDGNRPQYSFILEDVQANARHNASAEEGAQIQFKLTALLKKKESSMSGSYVESSGWFDLEKMDMDEKLAVNHPDGKTGLTANIISINNDVAVEGNIRYSGSLSEHEGFESLRGLLPATGIKVGAKFSFVTKMNDFRITKVKFSGLVDALEDSQNDSRQLSESLIDSVAQ